MKKIPITLLLDEDIVDFHREVANGKNISLEKRLVQLILEHSPTGAPLTRERLEQFFEGAQEIAGKYSVPFISTKDLDPPHEQDDK